MYMLWMYSSWGCVVVWWKVRHTKFPKVQTSDHASANAVELRNTHSSRWVHILRTLLSLYLSLKLVLFHSLALFVDLVHETRILTIPLIVAFSQKRYDHDYNRDIYDMSMSITNTHGHTHVHTYKHRDTCTRHAFHRDLCKVNSAY